MRLIAEAIRILRAKFHCNRLTTVEDIQDYASLIFLGLSDIHWMARLAGGEKFENVFTCFDAISKQALQQLCVC